MDTNSQKTTDERYSELGLTREQLMLLRTYFLCFANLYGMISMQKAWEVFRNYEGIGTVRKKDFLAFSGIVRDEPDLPYSIYELQEVYLAEESDDPKDRLLINNRLVGEGQYRFLHAYSIDEQQANKPYYLPDKLTFLSFSSDQFYMTDIGLEMTAFVESLRTDGVYKDFEGKPTGDILDVYGVPANGKRLRDFVMYSKMEQLTIESREDEAERQKLQKLYAVPASEKFLQQIELYMLTGDWIRFMNYGRELELLLNTLDKDYGVTMDQSQISEFYNLLVDLNNYSNLWVNKGWRPMELTRAVVGEDAVY